jgi:hypothetical protein
VYYGTGPAHINAIALRGRAAQIAGGNGKVLYSDGSLLGGAAFSLGLVRLFNRSGSFWACFIRLERFS